MSSNDKLTGCIYAFLGFGLLSVTSAFAKDLGSIYSPIQITFFVYLTGFFLSSLLMWRHRLPLRPKKENTKPLLLMCIYSTVATYLFIAAPAKLPLADYSALLVTTPVIIAALSKLMLNERVSAAQWISIFMGLTGALVIINPSASTINWGAVLSFLAAFFFALEGIYFRKLSRENSYRVNFYFMAAGVVAFGILSPLVYENPVNTTDWFYFVTVGVTLFLVIQYLILANKHAPAALVAPFRYTKLLWGTLIGFFFWNEIPSELTLIGMLFIVSSGLILFLSLFLNKEKTSIL